MFPILSKNQIKFIRTLKQKKYRYKFKNYIVEGEKQIADISEHKPEIIDYIVLPEHQEQLSFSQKFDIYQVEKEVFKALSGMVHPQNIMAICRIPQAYFNKKWSEEGFALYFDGVQDPGNLGTMLRVAEWYGLKVILIGPGTVDPYSPKVVQSAMGSHSYLEIYQFDHESLGSISCPVLVADMKGADAFHMEWPENGVLVMGNEGQGVSSDVVKFASDRITLPSVPYTRTESLNVSMACASLLTLRHNFFRSK